MDAYEILQRWTGRPIVLAKPVTRDILAHVIERVRALTV